MVVLVLVASGLFLAGAFERPTVDAAAPSGPADPTPGPPQAPTVPGDLDPPEPDAHTGSDADFAQLLQGIEASERTMLRYQQELGQVFAAADPADLDAFLAAVRTVSQDGAAAITAARQDLDEPLGTAAAESVRTVYLGHLDAWRSLMEAAAQEPSLYGPTGDTSAFDREINATARDFAQALASSLPTDADPEIAAFVEDLLDRGFRFDVDAQV
ncbi:hypothetical protein GCM10011354_17380 [Egicoccus halophilus]|uniref:Uncharacterized protein n=1 Tax=Egicoccus halophilus TaxID=1670830 RepID=A0A8J3ADK1_9ACTN|nr:hypothetical protein GCM10011354_17380 [Egicoccus halophilus]